MNKYVQPSAQIIRAYVANNILPVAALPEFIANIHSAVEKLGTDEVTSGVQKPAVDPQKSVKRSHIICLEDGRKFKALRLHLERTHGLSPDEYRAKWDLPETYPMVAPDYAARRSEIALNTGLGIRPTPRRSGTGKRR